MAPKRKTPPIGNNALTYWISALDKLPAGTPIDSSHALIQDAHRWGESMVHAELAWMVADGRSADHRLKMLYSQGKNWYGRGYRFYLIPRSVDAPSAIATHTCPDARLMRNSACALRTLAIQAQETWWKACAKDIVHAATQCAEAEKAATQARARARPAPNVARYRPPATPGSPAFQSPSTMVASNARLLVLPQPLASLLAHPAEKVQNAPHADIQEVVLAAFYNQRILRVWNRHDEVRKLTMLDARAYCLQLELEDRGLQSVYGGGATSRGAAILEREGLVRRGKGGFNAIWGVERPTNVFAEVLPPEVVAPFNEGVLVLRTPHGHTEWMTLGEAVGEASNMLLMALCGIGPRIGALSFARKLVLDAAADEEGVTAVRYKIFAFLEKATKSVSERFAPDQPLCTSAIFSRPYHDALLVTIFGVSFEGFVHLDATLRNFVDFYPTELQATLKTFSVKVIDVEPKCFRRLCTTKTSDWRYLFLLNLLSVLVFLKIQLADSWNPSLMWLRVRRVCTELIAELPGRRNIAAMLEWTGRFEPDGGFPHLSEGIYAGDTHEAATRAASCQLKHYLLQQPLQEATANYLNTLHANVQDVARLRIAKAWFERVFRANLAPTRAFFLRALQSPNAAPRRFVEVAVEFLDLSHRELQKRFGGSIPPHHTRAHSRDYILGLV